MFEIMEQIREEACSAMIYAKKYLELKSFRLAKVYRKMAKDEVKHARNLMAIGENKPQKEKYADLWSECIHNIEETLSEVEIMLR